jgi:hypothetical protein
MEEVLKRYVEVLEKTEKKSDYGFNVVLIRYKAWYIHSKNRHNCYLKCFSMDWFSEHHDILSCIKIIKDSDDQCLDITDDKQKMLQAVEDFANKCRELKGIGGVL